MPYRFIAFLLLISFSAVAKEKVYLVGVEDINYFPLYNFSVQSKDKSSYTKDLLTEFFTSHQIKFRFIPLPIKRFNRWYREDSIDFKFPDNFRWRDDYSNKMGLHFSEPALKLLAGTYVSAVHKNATRKDITTLATISGFYPSLWLQEVESGKVTLQEENSALSIVRHLLAGNVSATNIDENVIRNSLIKLNRDGEVVLAKNIFNESFNYHLSSIKYPEIIEQFNQFLKERKPFIDSLKEKYNIVE